MKKKYFLTMSLVIISALILLAGCGSSKSSSNESDNSSNVSSESGSDKPTIAVVLKGSDAEYFKLAEAGAKQAFEDFDVNGKFLAASTQTQEQELINILEDLLTEDPEALVLMPSTGSVIPTLTQYSEKDIPVLLIDTDLDWEDKVTYIGTDNYTAGEKAAEYLTSILTEGDEVAIIEGVSGAAQNEARVAGATDMLEEHGLKIVTVQAADFDRTKAVNVMENIITAHPNVKGVFTANDEMALGALQAIHTSNLEIPVIGIDGTSDALKSISQGDLDAVIQQLPYQMAYIGVENAIRAINGETVDPEIDSGIDLITIDNAQEKLDQLNDSLGK